MRLNADRACSWPFPSIALPTDRRIGGIFGRDAGLTLARRDGKSWPEAPWENNYFARIRRAWSR